MKTDLKEKWIIKSVSGLETYKTNIPGSLVSALLNAKKIENPYYRDNETNILSYLHQDCIFTKEFNIDKNELGLLNYLVIKGIDGAAKIYLNDRLIKEVDDVHIHYYIKIDKSLVNDGKNILKIHSQNVRSYLDENFRPDEHFEGFCETYDYRFPKIRKAHCSFGWDWGIAIPDMGINEDIYLLSTSIGNIEYIKAKTSIIDKTGCLDLDVYSSLIEENVILSLSLTYKNELIINQEIIAKKHNHIKLDVDKVKVWNPNGYGKQNLYRLNLCLLKDDEAVRASYNIGFKNLEIIDQINGEKDLLSIKINDCPIFLKGSDFIPMDAIYSNVGYKETKRLLQMVKDSHQNVIRVWGGGYYPKDYFFDLCDELGLLVFEDLMFACATYDSTDKHFMKNIKVEVTSNIRRFSYHPSMLLISGNNECEDMLERKYPYESEKFHTLEAKKAMNSYKEIFIDELKKIVEDNSYLYYLSSSPTSSNGLFNNPNQDENLDMHCWNVWHGMQAYSYYETIHPSILSEFGMQAIPNMDTIDEFALEEDKRIDSNVMLCHEKNKSGDKKINAYISMYFNKSETFKSNIYLSQLIQALSLKTAINHLRLNAYNTTGVIYWQLNDTYPVISWSVIDYYFRPKMAYYETLNAYKPSIVLLKDKRDKISINVINEHNATKDYMLKISEYSYDSKALYENVSKITLKAFEVKEISSLKKTTNSLYEAILYDDKFNILSRDYKFSNELKDIPLKEANIKIKKIDNKTFSIISNTLALYVYLTIKRSDVLFSDNNFILIKDREIFFKTSKDVEVDEIRIESLNDYVV